MKSPNGFLICPEHSHELYAAAESYGCSTKQEFQDFVAHCLIGGLYDPEQQLPGDDTKITCVCCAQTQEAINAAVVAAMATLRSYGLAPSLN